MPPALAGLIRSSVSASACSFCGPASASFVNRHTFFFELLCRAHVECILFNRVTKTLAGNVAERSVFPRVRHRKKYCSIAPHKNKFILVLAGGAGCFGRCRRRGRRSGLRALHSPV